MPTDLAQPFETPDYEDHFVLASGDTIAGIDDFVERLVLRQPRWLTGVSMGITNQDAIRNAMDGVLDRTQDAVGNWNVVGRTDTSITFAEDMRIMRYRISYTVNGDREVAVRTEVEQQTRWFGPVYWALATPLHQRFVQRMLRNAGGPHSTTRAAD